jgi:hypothetical protein
MFFNFSFLGALAPFYPISLQNINFTLKIKSSLLYISLNRPRGIPFIPRAIEQAYVI